ncbi:MAG: sugar phosphate isomerase/epimerase [Anaerolineae bacterium]|nr:sugar phosphate isomerase/epimerase [Anaerolineae bacterium]
MRFGVCVKTVEEIGVLAEAGFDFCELPAASILPFEDDRAAEPTLRAFEAAPLRSESFNVLVPGSLPLAGPEVDRDAVRGYFERVFPRMARLGAQVAVLGSGAARRIPDGWPRERALDQLAEDLKLAGDTAARSGIELCLEHLNRTETNVFNSVAECQGFIETRGLSSVRLLADLHHLAMEHEALAHVVAAAPYLAHVHVADGGRRAPGGGGYAYTGFMAALRACGYDRRISAECSWDNLAGQARGAGEFMRRMWAEA